MTMIDILGIFLSWKNGPIDGNYQTTYLCKYVTYDKKGHAILYMKLAKAVYGMLKRFLLLFMKQSKELKHHTLEHNPYD